MYIFLLLILSSSLQASCLKDLRISLDEYSLLKKIEKISHIINEERHQEISDLFFKELKIAQKKLQKFRTQNKWAQNKSQRTIDWAHSHWAYIYPDKIGIDEEKTHGTFYNLAKNLDYYKKLNIDVLYILPHYQGPKMDDGYDVSHYQRSSSHLGGNRGFDFFIKEATQKNLKVIIDFIPGHVSKEHPWFKKALKNNKYYQDYFIHTENIPESEYIKSGGNEFIKYHDDLAGPYHRLLLLPDISKSHWYPSKIKGLNRPLYFYSSFFPFQKDLDNTNPNVLREHLKTLAYWISKGISGIRADATPFWIKRPGTDGMHLRETFAMSEYFHLFLKHLDKSILYLPEVVDTSKNSTRYLGKTAKINNEKTGSHAGAILNFEKSVHILYAGVSGNFDGLYKYLKKYKEISYPENTLDILYSGNHHDEIYIGLLHEHLREDFRNLIRNSQGIVYKGGQSGGARVANFFKGRPQKINNFHKFLLGHHGTISIYQGSELGHKNNIRYALEKTLSQLPDKQNSLYKECLFLLSLSDDEISSILSSSSIYDLIDGRLLHRSQILENEIQNALDGQSSIYSFLSRLIKIRKQTPALFHGEREIVLETFDSQTFAFLRVFSNKKSIQKVLVLSNGSPELKTLNINKENIGKIKPLEKLKLMNHSVLKTMKTTFQFN